MLNLPTCADPSPETVKQPPNPRLVMVTLLAITFIVEIICLGLLSAFGWLRLPIVFLVFLILFFCVSVLISLVLAKYITTFFWNRNLDPDMYALPIHSALVDLIGQLLLVGCFEIVSLLGSPVKTAASE